VTGTHSKRASGLGCRYPLDMQARLLITALRIWYWRRPRCWVCRNRDFTDIEQYPRDRGLWRCTDPNACKQRAGRPPAWADENDAGWVVSDLRKGSRAVERRLKTELRQLPRRTSDTTRKQQAALDAQKPPGKARHLISHLTFWRSR
jgi:hypothetical protein